MKMRLVSFDKDPKRYWLTAVRRGKAAVQVSGERPDWIRTIATLAFSTL